MFGPLTRWLWRRVPHRHCYQGFETATHIGARCSRCGFVGYCVPRRKT